MRRLLIGLAMCASLASCGGSGDNGPALSLTASTPANGAASVARTVSPQLTFGAALDPASVTPQSVTLTSVAGPQPAAVVASGNRLTITPAAMLLPMTTYTITVGTGVKGSMGEGLSTPITTTFVTQDGIWHPSVPIDGNTPGTDYGPQIAFAPNGNALAAWTNYQAGSASTLGSLLIWASRYIAGSGWGAPELVGSFNAEEANGPSVGSASVDSAGNANVVINYGVSAQHNAYASHYATGGGWDAPKSIGLDETSYLTGFAADSAGNLFAVGWSFDLGLAHYSLWSNQYRANGGWGTASVINTVGATSVQWPVVTTGPDGTALAVWGQTDVNNKCSIWSAVYAAGGGWGAPSFLTSSEYCYAQIASDANGNALAMWIQFDGTRYSMWTSRYAPGVGWGASTQVTDSVTGTAEIAVNAVGNAVAVWVLSDGTHDQLWSSRYAPGVGWGVAALANSGDGGDVTLPNSVLDASGNAIVAWYKLVGGQLDSAWASRFTPRNGWAPATLLDASPAAPSNTSGIALSLDASGNAMAVQAHTLATGDRIYAERFD